MWVETSLLETSLLEIRAEVAEKLRNFQCYHNFPGKVFVYWKSKKLEDNVKNTLNSCHCTASLAILT